MNAHRTLPRQIAAIVTIILVLQSSGCALRRTQLQMGKLSSAVTKLSSDVESVVRFSNIPPDISDNDLLARSTENDPQILKFFSKHMIRILRNDRDAIVLVCSKDQKKALFEDAGCTAQLDKILWNEKPPKKCDFTTTVEIACPTKSKSN